MQNDRKCRKVECKIIENGRIECKLIEKWRKVKCNVAENGNLQEKSGMQNNGGRKPPTMLISGEQIHIGHHILYLIKMNQNRIGLLNSFLCFIIFNLLFNMILMKNGIKESAPLTSNNFMGILHFLSITVPM